jgi:hypothetical protein
MILHLVLNVLQVKEIRSWSRSRSWSGSGWRGRNEGRRPRLFEPRSLELHPRSRRWGKKRGLWVGIEGGGEALTKVEIRLGTTCRCTGHKTRVDGEEAESFLGSSKKVPPEVPQNKAEFEI